MKRYTVILVAICTILLSVSVFAKDTSFSQYDRRWKSYEYGYRNVQKTKKGTLSSSGCGILALTNAVFYYNGNFVDPKSIADFSVDNGFRVDGQGTSMNLYSELSNSKLSNKYDFSASKPEAISLSKMKKWLGKGNVVIVSTYTLPYKTSHIMAIVRYDEENDRFLIVDSAPSDSRFSEGTAWQKIDSQLVTENNHVQLKRVVYVSKAGEFKSSIKKSNKSLKIILRKTLRRTKNVINRVKTASRRAVKKIRRHWWLYLVAVFSIIGILIMSILLKGKNVMKKFNISRKLIVLLVGLVVLVIAVICMIKLYNQGIIHIHNPSHNKYPVRGVDVSHYQGDIDWETLTEQNIDFAFIKATEGSSYVDPCFEKNWKNAQKTGIRMGAYHFFSFQSSGQTQAELFCRTVKPVDNMLPPVIDLEYYGKYKHKRDIDIPKIKIELRTLVDALNEKYGVKPIIYCGLLYNSVVKGDFDDCDLWYSSVYLPLINKKKCTFWQYSNNHILKGYAGSEKFIDMNVFMGNKKSFDNFNASSSNTQSQNTRVGIVNIPSSWDNLNIRSGSSTSYQIVGSMNQGERCTVYPDKASNGWYYIEYNGVYGYVSRKQINLQ